MTQTESLFPGIWNNVTSAMTSQSLKSSHLLLATGICGQVPSAPCSPALHPNPPVPEG